MRKRLKKKRRTSKGGKQRQWVCWSPKDLMLLKEFEREKNRYRR